MGVMPSSHKGCITSLWYKMGSNPIRKTLPPYIGDKMKKPFNNLHKTKDHDVLDEVVLNLRLLHQRAKKAMVQDPDLAGYTASLELALQNAEKAFEQF